MDVATLFCSAQSVATAALAASIADYGSDHGSDPRRTEMSQDKMGEPTYNVGIHIMHEHVAIALSMQSKFLMVKLHAVKFNLGGNNCGSG